MAEWTRQLQRELPEVGASLSARHLTATICPVSSDSIPAWITFCAARPSAPEPSISSGATPVRHLLQEAVDALAEGVVEVAVAAEDRVGVDRLHQIARRDRASPRATCPPARSAPSAPATSQRSIGCPRSMS